MQSTSPDEAVRLIRTRASQFESGEADDPKRLVDGIMSEIEAVLGDDDVSAAAYIETVARQTNMMLTGSGERDHETGRRQLFFRSMLQLLASRQALNS